MKLLAALPCHECRNDVAAVVAVSAPDDAVDINGDDPVREVPDLVADGHTGGGGIGRRGRRCDKESGGHHGRDHHPDSATPGDNLTDAEPRIRHPIDSSRRDFVGAIARVEDVSPRAITTSSTTVVLRRPTTVFGAA